MLRTDPAGRSSWFLGMMELTAAVWVTFAGVAWGAAWLAEEVAPWVPWEAWTAWAAEEVVWAAWEWVVDEVGIGRGLVSGGGAG